MKTMHVISAAVGIIAFSGIGAVSLHYFERHQARSDLDAVGITFSESNFVDEACNGNRAAVVLFLKTGMNANTSGKDDFTPLHCAARHGQDKLISLLLSKKANVSARSKDERTPLHEAVQKGSVEATKLLLDHGAEVNAVNRNGDSALMLSNFRNNELVELLLARGADIKLKNKNGETALLRLTNASGSNKDALELVDRFIKSGVDVNASTKDGRTALINAVSTGNKKLAEKLLAAGSEVNAQSAYTTPLLAANSNVELLKLLLDNKADPNLAPQNGLTPLENSAKQNNLEAVRLLLDSGAKPDSSGLIGRDSALHYAASNGNYEISRMLLSKGADANSRGARGRSPLHSAIGTIKNIDNNRINVIKALIEFGGKLDATDSQGQTPFQLAQQIGNVDLFDLLSPKTTQKKPTPPGSTINLPSRNRSAL